MEKGKLPEDINKQPEHKKTTSTTNEEIRDTFGDKLYAISFKAINETMDSRKPFTLQEVTDKIRSRWWIPRVGICFTIREYLNELIKLWRLKGNEEKYEITEFFLAEGFGKVA